MQSGSSEDHVREAAYLSHLEAWVAFLRELMGPGVVRVLFSGAPDGFSCACLSPSREGLADSLLPSGAFEISPVPSCPTLSQGRWSILAQGGESPVGHSDVLCVASPVEGVGALAVQVGLSRFARRDFRYRRILCGGLRMGLISAMALLESRRLQALAKERDEQARQLARSLALAREVESERLSLQLHDGLIQGLVSATHMIEALREMVTRRPEEEALLKRSEELLRQSVQEARGIISVLHSPAPGQGMGG